MHSPWGAKLKHRGGTRAWRAYLVLSVLAVGAYFLLPAQGAQHGVRLLLVISALVAVVAGLLMNQPARPLPWYLFAGAILSSIGGTVVYGYYESVLGIRAPATTLADAFFLASYPCAISALLLIQGRRLIRDRASTIDPLIVAVGLGLLMWHFLMRPYAEDPSLGWLERLVSMAYPLMDVLLLAVVVRSLLARGERPFAYYPLVAGLSSLLVFDILYAAMTLAGTYGTGSSINAAELLFYVLFGTAALHPSMVDLSTTVLSPETKLTRWRLVLLAAASLIAPGLLALQAASGEFVDLPLIAASSSVLFLLVLLRMAGIMRVRERIVERERLLRRTAAELVAASDRKRIHEVALDATRTLLEDLPGSVSVAIATGSTQQLTVLAARGSDAEKIIGSCLYLREYSSAARTGLMEGRAVEVEDLRADGSLGSLVTRDGPPYGREGCLVPLLVQARLRGAILALADTPLSEEMKATLEALGREVALALESMALAEQLHRRESEERFRSLIQNSSDVVMIVEADGRARYVSPAVERILGYKPENGVGRTIFGPPMMHPHDTERVRDVFARLSRSPGIEANVDCRLRHADGRWIHVEAIAKNLLSDPSVRGIVVNYRDVTERKTFERQLRHQAFHDPLTNLPNRSLFMDRLGHALVRQERRGGSVAVLFMDLDNFKVVNDSLGHEAGDRLLVAIARRLRGRVRAEDTAARLGGDEFTILLEGVQSSSDALEVAEQIKRSLEEPFTLEGREVFATASIGIALGTPGRERPTDLLRNADLALYHAKSSGKAACEVFDVHMNVLAAERLDLEADLRRALDRREFAVYYQPQLDLLTGTTVGWEGLVRWEHPQRGMVLPSTFLSIAEETGLISQIGDLVLYEACRQVRAWQLQHPSSAAWPKASVNISPRQFRHQADLVEQVSRALEETGLAPRNLVLEITETMVMEDVERNVEVLRQLKALGVQIAIDDFGTGYSNLANLKRFPIDVLKIDRSFVQGLGISPEDTAIVEAIMSFARALNLRTVAEGIETTQQLDRLRDLGCDAGQGYYFSTPLPSLETDELPSGAYRNPHARSSR